LTFPATDGSIPIEDWSKMFYSWYYGQTFIDSEVEALLIEEFDGSGNLESFSVAPYHWMLT